MCKAMALIFFTMLLSILPHCSHAIPILCLLGVVWVNPKWELFTFFPYTVFVWCTTAYWSLQYLHTVVCHSADDKHLQQTTMSIMNEIIVRCNHQPEHETWQIVGGWGASPPSNTSFFWWKPFLLLWQLAPLMNPILFRWCHFNNFVVLCEYLTQISSRHACRMNQRRSKRIQRDGKVRETRALPNSRSMRRPGVDCPTRNPFDSTPICLAINTLHSADKRIWLTSKRTPATMWKISNKMSIINGGEGSPFKWKRI